MDNLKDKHKRRMLKYKQKKVQHEEFEKRLLQYRDLAAESVDGFKISLLANIEIVEEVDSVMAYGADGIGLFRTEFLYLNKKELPSEEELFEIFKKTAQTIAPRPVTIRTLDIGGDKPLPFLRLKKEANPFLGFRGARFLLGDMDIFSCQLQALARLSLKRVVNILFPMVIDCVQMRLLIDRSREVIGAVAHNYDQIRFGAMFEVPSAFIQARQIMSIIDFASIGSNDLIQYLFAIDRDNEMVSQDYDPEHPALWTFLSDLSTIAREEGKPLSICGEMAAREHMPGRLLDAGISSLSVAPRLIPRVRGEMIDYSRQRTTTTGETGRR